jgi:hypothetical protein
MTWGPPEITNFPFGPRVVWVSDPSSREFVGFLSVFLVLTIRQGVFIGSGVDLGDPPFVLCRSDSFVMACSTTVWYVANIMPLRSVGPNLFNVAVYSGGGGSCERGEYFGMWCRSLVKGTEAFWNFYLYTEATVPAETSLSNNTRGHVPHDRKNLASQRCIFRLELQYQPIDWAYLDWRRLLGLLNVMQRCW